VAADAVFGVLKEIVFAHAYFSSRCPQAGRLCRDPPPGPAELGFKSGLGGLHRHKHVLAGRAPGDLAGDIFLSLAGQSPRAPPFRHAFVAATKNLRYEVRLLFLLQQME
jgi:hypothetical protein